MRALAMHRQFVMSLSSSGGRGLLHGTCATSDTTVVGTGIHAVLHMGRVSGAAAVSTIAGSIKGHSPVRAFQPSSAHQQCLIVPNRIIKRRSIIPYRLSSIDLIIKKHFLTSSTNSTTTSKMAQSKIRQNYHEESEAGVNKQINLELYASYVYQQLAFHFNRDDVALPGFEKFFKDSSEEEREHAERLMKFQNQRGGRIRLQDIPKPIKQDWASGLEAMEAALELEKTVNQSLLDLHVIASRHGDAQMADFIETHYLTEQVEAIKKLSDYVTNLRRVGNGLGEYLFDKHTLSS